MLPNVRRQSARLTREQSTHDSIVHVLDNIVHAIEASVLPGVLASSGNSPAAVARRDAIANVGLQSFLQIAKTPRSTLKTKTPTTRNLASCIQGYFSTTYILVYLRISHHIEGWAACIGGGGGRGGVAWREGQRLVATATKTLQLLQHNFRRGVGQRV